MKAVPAAVSVTTLTAATLSVDTAGARPAGRVSIEVSRPQAPRAGGWIPQEKCPEEPLWMWGGGAGQAHPTLLSHRDALPPALPRRLLGSQL